MSDHTTNGRAEQPGDPLVTHIMRTDVPTIGPDASIGETARILVEFAVPGVAVVEGNKIIGIITEADIITREAEVEVPTPVPFLDAIFMADAGPDFNDEIRKVTAVNARQLMTSPVISIRSTATLTEVATLMVDRRINPIPVLDDEMRVVGIVSRSDLVKIISALENQA
jgi:CBS domain-containing protein